MPALHALPVVLALTKVAPVDPLTFWVPAGALVVAAIVNVASIFLGTRLAGSNSDKALDRTIQADRRARTLERQLDLYGKVLTFAAKRQQHRGTILPAAEFEGLTTPDPYQPLKLWNLEGRARAFADQTVLNAFLASNVAEQAITTKHYLLARIVPAGPDWAKNYSELDELKGQANALDIELMEAIRIALHQRL
jgi:hypothetical protein